MYLIGVCGERPGGLCVQVGLGGIQNQPLYNLHDLGGARFSEPCSLICVKRVKFPPGQVVVGHR